MVAKHTLLGRRTQPIGIDLTVWQHCQDAGLRQSSTDIPPKPPVRGMKTPAIQATGPGKSLDQGAAPTVVVGAARFEACYGEIPFTAGPSGNRKAALLSMIAPTSAEVAVKGAGLWQMSAAP